MKKIAITLVFMLVIGMSYSQTIKNPKIDFKAIDYLDIVKIERNYDNTIIYFQYETNKEFTKGGWFNIRPEIVIKESNGNRTYKLIKVEGVELAPKKTYSQYPGQIFSFRLFFPSISNNIEKIDIIECSAKNCFNFYGISLSNKQLDNKRIIKNYNKIEFWFNSIKYFEIFDNTTFIIENKKNGNILKFDKEKGKRIYKITSNFKDGYNQKGNHYILINTMDEDGNNYIFQIFDSNKLGLKIISDNGSFFKYLQIN